MSAGKQQPQAGLMLDHLIVFKEVSLPRILHSYFERYHKSRIHFSSDTDSPEPRPIPPVEMGRVVAVPFGWWTSLPLRTTSRLSKTFSLLIVPIKHPGRSALRT